MCAADYSSIEMASKGPTVSLLDSLGLDFSKLTRIVDPGNPEIEHWSGIVAKKFVSVKDRQGDVEGEKRIYLKVKSSEPKKIIKAGIDLNGCVFGEVVFNGAYKFLINPQTDTYLWDKKGELYFLAIPENTDNVLTSSNNVKGVLGILLNIRSFKVIGTRIVKL